MKVYWVTVGIGVLVLVIGGVFWLVSDHRIGLILILSGMVVAVLGLVMRLIQWGMSNSKKRAA